MLTSIEQAQKYASKELPNRLIDFYQNEADLYVNSSINNLPGWNPETEFELNFSAHTIKELNERHADWLLRESEDKACIYLAFSSLEDEIDFLAVEITNEDCPVYFGNHEDGSFELLYHSLDDFVDFLDDDESRNPLVVLPELYETAKEDFSDENYEEVIDSLGAYFDKHPVNPAIPSPLMRMIPDALNLVACAHGELKEKEKQIELLDLACRGIFAQSAYLNRVRYYLLEQSFEKVIDLCNEGLERFSNEFTRSFLFLYKDLAQEELEDEQAMLETFKNIENVIDMEDIGTAATVAILYVHYLPMDDFEEVFTGFSAIIKNHEQN